MSTRKIEISIGGKHSKVAVVLGWLILAPFVLVALYLLLKSI